MRARALWHVVPGRAELRPEELPAPGPEEVLVRTLCSGISRGTERLVSSGQVPPSQWQAMRAPLQAGEFPFPVKYGYAAVGEVQAGPAALLGRRVFCLHPHQDVFNVAAAMCAHVPDDVPDARAVLAANMETALNILWDAAPLAGERVLVVGAGVVGLLVTALLARIPGVRPWLSDTNPARAAVAAGMGVRFCAPADAPDDCELIVHASGNPAGLRLALECAAFEARIVEASWFGTADVALPLGETFHSRRLRLIASQVGAVAPAMRARRSHAERLALALDLLADARFDALVGPAVAFEDLPAALPALLGLVPSDGPAPLCPLVTYGSR